jgi:hypothetical protein
MGLGVVRGLRITGIIFVWLNQQKFNLREKRKPAKEGYIPADTQQSVTKILQTGL